MILGVEAVRVRLSRRIVLAAAIVLAVGCAPPQQVANRPADGWPLEPVTKIFEATIVDLDPESGRMTVKDRDRWETWTVAITTDTWLSQDGAGPAQIGVFEVGDRVRVTGSVRIPLIITATEIVRLEAPDYR